MTTETDEAADLDRLQSEYHAGVEKWIAAIRVEEALAAVEHSIADLDAWEAAHFHEEEARNEVRAAKTRYEDALREKFFDF